MVDDTISRQATIDAIEKAMCEDGFRSSTGLIHKTTAYEVIRHLPSTQPSATDTNVATTDTISRQAAIDAIESAFDRETILNRFVRKIAISAVRLLPSAQPEQRWIPTSERLPKVREWVLCQCRAGVMDVLRLTDDGYWNKNYPHVEYMSNFVIAWMPLPEPYREEDGNG